MHGNVLLYSIWCQCNKYNRNHATLKLFKEKEAFLDEDLVKPESCLLRQFHKNVAFISTQARPTCLWGDSEPNYCILTVWRCGGKNLIVWRPVSWALSKQGVLVSLAQDCLGGTRVHFTFWRACPLEDNTIHFRRVSYTCSSQQRSSTTNSKSDRATPAFQWCQSYLSAQKSHNLKIKMWLT